MHSTGSSPAIVALGPGSFFWAATAFGLGSSIIAIFSVFTGADPGARNLALIVLVPASAIGWATSAYLRLPLQVGAEASGIWLRRNGRLARSVPWAEMVSVRYGGISVAADPDPDGKRVPHSKFIEVRGRRRGQRVWAGEGVYRPLDGSLEAVVEWVFREAERRGIRIQPVLVE